MIQFTLTLLSSLLHIFQGSSRSATKRLRVYPYITTELDENHSVYGEISTPCSFFHFIGRRPFHRTCLELNIFVQFFRCCLFTSIKEMTSNSLACFYQHINIRVIFRIALKTSCNLNKTQLEPAQSSCTTFRKQFLSSR